MYFTESLNLEFRTEVFNLTNTPPLGAPKVVADSAGFGSITSAGDPGVIRFGVESELLVAFHEKSGLV